MWSPSRARSAGRRRGACGSGGAAVFELLVRATDLTATVRDLAAVARIPR
jgi:hypothetical protein